MKLLATLRSKVVNFVEKLVFRNRIRKEEEHKAKMRKYAKEYYQKNKYTIRKKHRERYMKKSVAAKRHAYYIKNKDKILAQNKINYEKRKQ